MRIRAQRFEVDETAESPPLSQEIEALQDEVYDLRSRLRLVADALAALSAELKTALR
jgi:hypothetical protein